MITQETAVKIHNCYWEIEKAQNLITDLKETLAKTSDLKLLDAFGDRKGLQLSVPSSSSSRSLYNVPPELTMDIIEAHIELQRKKLLELRTIALIELKG